MPDESSPDQPPADEDVPTDHPPAGIDRRIIGCWKVLSLDAPPDRMLRIISGLPGYIVEFTAGGHYLTDLADQALSYRYRAQPLPGLSEMDIWSDGMRDWPAAGVYQVDAQALRICVAANDGPRPTELCMCPQRLWCVLTLVRTDRPTRTHRRRQHLLRPGSLIPDSLLDPPR